MAEFFKLSGKINSRLVKIISMPMKIIKFGFALFSSLDDVADAINSYSNMQIYNYIKERRMRDHSLDPSKINASVLAEDNVINIHLIQQPWFNIYSLTQMIRDVNGTIDDVYGGI